MRKPFPLVAAVLCLLAACVVWVGALQVDSAFAQDAPTKPGEKAAAAACVLCSDLKTVDCTECEATGKVKGVCPTCGGKGSRECEWGSQLIHVGKTGRFACPNPICKGGKISWDDKKVSGCKLCGKRGKFACKSCDLAKKSKCKTCRGAKKVAGQCDGCAGFGKQPCFLCVNESTCKPCTGKRVLSCQQCRGGSKLVPQTCFACLGSGDDPCTECFGTSKLICLGCFATGMMRGRYIDNTTAYSKKCDSCRRKGVFACSCKRGVVNCRMCSGKGHLGRTCFACGGDGDVSCLWCGLTNFRTLVFQAKILEKNKHRVLAMKLYMRAQERASAALESAEAGKKAAEARAPEKPPEVDPKAPAGEQAMQRIKQLRYLTAMLPYRARLDHYVRAVKENRWALGGIKVALARLAGESDD